MCVYSSPDSRVKFEGRQPLRNDALRAIGNTCDTGHGASDAALAA